MKTTRVVIYPKDIQRITGRSERYGRKLMNEIREHLNKATNQFVSVEEFCHFTGLNIETVTKFLQD